MKPEAVNENDLLALIEGDLDAERALVVRATLAKDPRLIKRVEAMKSDREVLRGLFADAQTDAPGGLVRDAISIAEREGLIAEAPKPAAARIVIKRRLIARPMAAGLALAAMVGVIGAGAAIVVSLTKSDEQLAAEAKGPPEYFIDVPDVEAIDSDTTQLAEQFLPGPSSTGSEALARLAQALASEDGPNGEELVGPVEYAVRHGGPTLIPETAHPWAELLADDGPGVTVLEAAQLAMENRLELTISAEDTGAWAQASGQVLAMGDLHASIGDRPAAGQGSRETLHFTLEITVPWDASLSALQDELGRLRGRVNRRAGVRQAMYQAVASADEIESPDSSNEQRREAGVLPSREVQHVLWWMRPTSSWERHLSVRVPITIVPASDAP